MRICCWFPCPKFMYSSKKDINWEIEIVLLYRLGNSTFMILCLAQIQINTFSDLTINTSQSLSFLSPLALFPLLWAMSVIDITLRFFLQTNHATERTIVYPLLLCKMSSLSLDFIGFGTYYLRNLAGADHRNKHSKVRKLPEFSLCWFLVIFFFSEKKLENPKTLLSKMWLISLNSYSRNTHGFLEPLKCIY